MPNRGGPNLTPLERDRLKLVKQGLGYGLDPSFAGSEIDSILAGAQTRVANRQAQMAPLTDALLQQAAAGAPAGASTALTNAYTAINPGLAGPKSQATLGAFQSALYPDQGGTSPLYQPAPGESTAPTSLDAEDLAGIDALLQPMIGQKNIQTGFPYGLHEATQEIAQRFRALSYPEEVIDQAKQYIAQRWAALGGA
jgi:hypothetical protein